MSAPFPSRYEVKLAGWSLICAHLVWAASVMTFLFFAGNPFSEISAHGVKTEEDVIKFHDAISSSNARTMMEVQAALFWLTFPLYLVAIYGIKKIYLAIWVGTKIEVWVYVLEKAYLLTLVVTLIIGPAISLVMVSFEWSFHEYTPEDDYIPTGYYIQLYAVTLAYEVYDAAAIADGLFLFLLCIIPQFRYVMTGKKYDVTKQHGCAKRVYHVLVVTLASSIAVAFLVSSFRFAKTGFFSLFGGASFLVIYGFILKFFAGFKLVRFASSKTFDEYEKAFSPKKNDQINDAQGYNMETLDAEKDPNDDIL